MSESSCDSQTSVFIPHLIGVIVGGALCASFAPIFAVLASGGNGAAGCVGLLVVVMGLFLAIRGQLGRSKRK